jgi:cysteinyl-tRNA synthetase
MHIGNLRSFFTADILRRYLQYKGFKVYYVKNITDVGHMFADSDWGQDKILEAAKKERKDPYELARFYETAFLEDEGKMNIRPANVYPRATEHIEDIIELIKELIKKGYGYEVSGSIYFRVRKFRRYGRLSGNTMDQLEAGKRIKPHPDKENPFDFALWKKAEAGRLMKWSSPWGEGYPGWHIECSAMSMKYLGEGFDIHTGGEDNIFPHHEDEIAQSEGLTGKKFVKYWVHTRHLLVNNQKMSKSKGNFYTLRDLQEKGYNPLSLRYLFLTCHFKDRLNFTLGSLSGAENTIEGIKDFMWRLENIKSSLNKQNREIKTKVKKVIKDFKKEMDDDLNTPSALASIFDFIKDVNKLMDQGELSKKDCKLVYDTMMEFDRVLGIVKRLTEEEQEVSEDIRFLIAEREEARKKKDWAHADAIRDQLKEEGIELEDTPSGTHWRKIKK